MLDAAGHQRRLAALVPCVEERNWSTLNGHAVDGVTLKGLAAEWIYRARRYETKSWALLIVEGEGSVGRNLRFGLARKLPPAFPRLCNNSCHAPVPLLRRLRVLAALEATLSCGGRTRP